MVPIYMAVDLDPFQDVRVRQAMRLIADRPALVEAAQAGFGVVGNDVFGYRQPDYNTDLPQRTQDIEQAKSLLKAAGKSDLRVTLYSSTVAPGMLESATAFAQQAKAAGVTVKVNNGPTCELLRPQLPQAELRPDPVAGIRAVLVVPAGNGARTRRSTRPTGAIRSGTSSTTRRRRRWTTRSARS